MKKGVDENMKMLTKMSGLFAVVLVLSLVLAACGGGNNSGGQQASSGGSGGGTSQGQSANQSQGSDAQDDKVYTINISYENNPGEPVDLAVQEWKRLAEEKSGGRLILETYPSSQLGSKVDVIEQMMTGANVIAIADASFLMDYVPDLGIVSGPYLTENYDQLFKLTQSDWFKEQEAKLQEKGLHIVTTKWIYGTRHMVVNKPVTKPEDFKGMKIRVPNNQLFIKTIEGMGGTPTPMPWGDVYPALSQGVVDGAENPLPVLYGSKMHEQAKYVALTEHIQMISQWIAGQQFIESLPDDIVAILKETGDLAGDVMNEMVMSADAETIEKLKEAGVTVNEVDVAAFRAAVEGIYSEFPEWTPGLFDKIQEIIRQ